jgi:tight adherence protein B
VTTVLAALLAAGAAALIAGRPPSLVTARVGPFGRAGRVEPTNLIPRRWRQRDLALGAVGGAAVGMAAAAVTGAVVGVIVGVGVTLNRRRRRSQVVQRALERDVINGCLSLAAELAAGTPGAQALAAVADEWPSLFGRAAARATMGGDPVVALREAAQRPGAESLGAVAVAWQVSERTGAGLAAVLVTVADALRAEESVRREADAHLATVRSTSRLLALLPVATVVLFSVGGAAPVRFLTSTPYGIACLLCAGLLVSAGLLWVDRMARAAVRSAWAR